MHTRRHSRGRTGFTLLELLVVIVIIGILVALISAAVFKAITKANQTRNKVEIDQLAAAIENFHTKFGVYPPSRLKLCENLTYYGATQLDTDSIAFIQRMFPRISTALWGGVGTGIDWNGNGVIDPIATGSVILEGDQCLAFCLGGIPANTGGPPACTGFSTNASNPAWHIANGGDVISPFFEFPSTRLVRRAAAVGNLYYSFLDNYGTSDGNGNIIAGLPYAYFSSYGRRNGYNRYYTLSPLSDCTTLGVWPYAEAMPVTSGPNVLTPRYVNPETFQIISAGADANFGSGTMIIAVLPTGQLTGAPTWTPTTAAQMYGPGAGGADDQSNFSSLIGAGD